jgi:hypothetical protein
MKKLLILALILIACSCVNGRVEIPNQDDQDETGVVNLIRFDF